MTSTRIAAAMIVAAVAASPVLAAKPSFTPSTLKGVYKGSWNNTTFGSSGTFTLTVKSLSKNKVLSIAAKVGGNGFGCPSVPGLPAVKLAKGVGANHWSGGGFRVVKSGSFGSIDATYVAKSGKLSATGKAPASCAAGVTYAISGSWKAGTLKGTATINLVGGQKATTTFTAKR
jgi:hypothetical protein